MPATFSVPDRFRFSCPPPCTVGDIFTPFLTNKAPIPLGPYILWLDKDSMSTPRSFTSIENLPMACTASVWNNASCSCVIFASSLTSWRVPISLFAYPIETRNVSSLKELARSSEDTIPSLSTGKYVISYPNFSNRSQEFMMAACSMEVVMM